MIKSVLIPLIFTFSLLGTSSAFGKVNPLPKKDSVEASVSKVKKKVAKAKKSATSPKKKSSYLASLGTKVDASKESEPLRLEETSSLAESIKYEADESEILLNLDKKSGAGEQGIAPQYSRFYGAIGAILFFGLLLLGWIARKGKNGALSSGMKNIRVLSKKSLGGKKELMVIRVAGESILLGVTDQNINLIKPLALLDDELPQLDQKNFSDEVAEHMEPIEETEFPEVVDGYAVSSLEDVREVVSQRYRT